MFLPGCGAGESGDKSEENGNDVPQPEVLKPTPTPKSTVEQLRDAFNFPAAETTQRIEMRNGEVVGVHLEYLPVDDISPLKGLPLEQLTLNHTNVSDLSPIAGMPLKQLNLQKTPVVDISPAKTLKSLNILWLNRTKVTDISAINDLSLISLDLTATKVTDLSPIAGMATLQRLNLEDCAVTDLTPLKGLSLQRLIFDPAKIRKGLDIVRNMGSLQHMHTYFPEGRQPQFLSPAEFWEKYDNNMLPRR